MAFKLSKEAKTNLAEHQKALELAYDNMTSAVQKYNDAFVAAKEFVEQQASDWQGELDDKSEAWQQDARGEAASELISQWEGVLGDYDEVSGAEASFADGLSELEHEVAS